MDLMRNRVDSFRNLGDCLVNDRLETTLRENIDEHRQSERIPKQSVFGVDHSAPGDCVALDDGHELVDDHVDDRYEQFGVFQFVRIQSFHQLLARVHRDVFSEGDWTQSVEGSWIEFQGALILKLGQDVLLNLRNRAFGVDEMVVIDFFQ